MKASSKYLPLFLIAALACFALCVCAPQAAHAASTSSAASSKVKAASTSSAASSKVKAASTSSAASSKAKAASTSSKKIKKIKTAAQWHNISKYNGGNFKVMKNIYLTSEHQYLTISKNKTYNIDLNGKKVATTYSDVPLRTTAPLYVKKGTVVLKSSDKGSKGTLYSTETAAVVTDGSSKFYLKSGSVVDDAVEFRSDITSAIMSNGSSKVYLQNTCRVQSIGNGVALFEKSRLYATGNPYVRAGANNYTGQFMHYGSGVSVGSRYARISLEGGSYGTKASPDQTLWSPAGSMTYAQSANYPILDQMGYALSEKKGFKFVDANGNTVAIRGANLSDYYDGVNHPSWTDLLASLGYKQEQRLTTTVKSTDGYYTIYVVPSGEKVANPMKVKATAKSVKQANVKKKAQTVFPITVSNERGSKSFAVSSWTTAKAKKYFSVNKSSGKVTVKKRTPKGTYKFKVGVSARGTNVYRPVTKIVTVTVKVK